MNKRNSIILVTGLVALMGIGFMFMKRHHGAGSSNSVAQNASENTAALGHGANGKLDGKSQNGQPGAPSNPESQSGTPVALAPNSPGAPAPAAPEAPKASCYLVNFHHKQIASHRDEEACSHHKNILKVDSENKINPASVCIRVNGTPVKYDRVKGKSDEFMIAAIAGPQAKISIRYCRDKEICNQDCKIPKDEFMDAIGGSDEAEAPKAGGKWDPNDKEGDMSAEVDGVQRDLASMENTDSGTYLFRDWINDGSAPTCGDANQKVAAK